MHIAEKKNHRKITNLNAYAKAIETCAIVITQNNI